MKKVLTGMLCAMLLLCTAVQAQQKEKVILDTDMVEVFDDGITMMMLAKAPNINLLGITVVVGNTWVPEGTAYALRQLEAIGRTDIPVSVGIRYPLHPNRMENIKKEIELFGIGDGYLGSAGYAEPESWQSVYRNRYGEDSKMKPIDMHAVNFIIEKVKENPGEITVLAIGTCVNLAVAVRMAPEIVPLIKRVIYMGGSFFKPGNTHPTAEFNWWLDPLAAKICLRTPFNEQIIVGLDVCEKVPFMKERYEKIVSITKNEKVKWMFENNFLPQLYKEDPSYVHFIWDVIAGAITIDPTLISEEVTRYVDVNAQFGSSFGQSIPFGENRPAGTQQARIILTVDSDRLWKMVEDYCSNF